MRRFAVATGLAGILLVPVVFLGAPSQAVDTPLDPLLPGPVRTIIKEVPVPGPVQTIINTVEVPGPVETIIKEVPGPVRTVIVTSPVPGPTRTIIVREGQEPVEVTSPVGQTPEPRATVSDRPVPQLIPAPPVPSAPVDDGRVPGEDNEVEVTVPEAIGISIGLVVLGIAAALLCLYLVYGVGFKDAKRIEEKKLADLNDELFGR